ncbi:Retrovirus-related Pol polyprotein from transposon TNT 1-94 [Nymphaea thermarum]|nr:Retrovirus-related Pol polyprotein from transposon TNT 1-94 [Nymphaea thermarum]
MSRTEEHEVEQEDAEEEAAEEVEVEDGDAESHRLYGHIDGTTPAPPKCVDREVKRTVVADQADGASAGTEIRFEYETLTENNPEYEVWLAHDQSLVAYITSTLSEEVLGGVDDDLTTLDLWSMLATTYSQVLEARFLQLKRQFQDIKRGTRTVLEYLNEIKNVSDQLAVIGHPVSDKDKVQQALSGLGTDFDIFCTALEVLLVLPSFEDLKAKLFQHEASRVQRQNLFPSSSHNVLITGTHALQGNHTHPWTPQTGMGRGILPTPPDMNTTSTTPRRVPTCFYCNKRGHVKSECWHNPQNKNNQIRRENKAAAGSASSSSDSNATSNISADVPQLLMTALSKLHLKQNEQGEWYVDFGAAAHVTGDTGNLSSVFPYLDQGSVVTGDGSHHTISHIGNAQISMGHSSIPLKNVLVVPNVKKNIISVSKLIDDTHSFVEFTPSSAYVKNARTKKTFVEGTRKGDMYVLEEAPKMSKPYLSDSSFPSHSEVNVAEYNKPSIWHGQLAHCSQSFVRSLVADGLLDKSSLNSPSEFSGNLFLPLLIAHLYSLLSPNKETGHRKKHVIEEEEPLTKTGKYSTWEEDNNIVMSWIMNSVQAHITPMIAYYTSAKHMWEFLKQTYSHDKNMSKVLQVEEELLKLQQGDSDLAQYFASVKSAYERLKALRPPCQSCYKTHFEQHMVAKFLAGLSPDFAVAKARMLTGAEIPDLAEAYNRLSRLAVTLSPSSTDASSSALAAPGVRGQSLAISGSRGQTFNRGRGGRSSGGGRGRFQCTFCGRLGHLEDRCWNKHGRPMIRGSESSQIKNSSHIPKASHVHSRKRLTVKELTGELAGNNNLSPNPNPTPSLEDPSRACEMSVEAGQTEAGNEELPIALRKEPRLWLFVLLPFKIEGSVFILALEL